MGSGRECVTPAKTPPARGMGMGRDGLDGDGDGDGVEPASSSWFDVKTRLHDWGDTERLNASD